MQDRLFNCNIRPEASVFTGLQILDSFNLFSGKDELAGLLQFINDLQIKTGGEPFSRKLEKIVSDPSIVVVVSRYGHNSSPSGLILGVLDEEQKSVFVTHLYVHNSLPGSRERFLGLVGKLANEAGKSGVENIRFPIAKGKVEFLAKVLNVDANGASPLLDDNGLPLKIEDRIEGEQDLFELVIPIGKFKQ